MRQMNYSARVWSGYEDGEYNGLVHIFRCVFFLFLYLYIYILLTLVLQIHCCDAMPTNMGGVAKKRAQTVCHRLGPIVLFVQYDT